MERRRAATVAVGSAVAVGLVAAGLVRVLFGHPGSPTPPPVRMVKLPAMAVATLEAVVTVARRGRVHAFRSSPGAALSAGDPLVELVDLGLLESRAELEQEIAHLRAEPSAPVPRDEVRSAAMQLRAAALQELETAFERALEEFERWKALHEDGLVARVEFERKREELTAHADRLAESRSQAADPEPAPVSREDPRPQPRLRRAERLLGRLAAFPETFLVYSPWDGRLLQLHVSEGDVLGRSAPLATVERASLARLEADTGATGGIVSVRLACGVPGPFPFSIRSGVLVLAAPDARIRPGDRCSIVVLARG